MDRLDKILAHEGFGSRKDIKKMMRACEVLVNGKRILDPGFQVDTEKDEIMVDDEVISCQKQLYLMMNKPKNTVSASKDGEHTTVFDLLDAKYRTDFLQDKLHLIGRLDLDTEGLLLFTTDGELTHRMISPKNQIPKTYFMVLKEPVSLEQRQSLIEVFAKGFEIPPEGHELGFVSKPAILKFPDDEETALALTNSAVSISEAPSNQRAVLSITEGKFHQVKRMWAAQGNEVIYLKRLAEGKLHLDETLPPGKTKEITRTEIED